jgi:hypothetical protein
VTKTVTQERWDKTKDKLAWIVAQLEEARVEAAKLEALGKPKEKATIPHKPLESIRGFLVYVGRTYTTMVPYLKGIHLTLDSWRLNRGSDRWPVDDDGWRLSNTVDDRLESPGDRQGGFTHLEYLYVTPHRNSAHRVTDIVTIFGRILYVFSENSVRLCENSVRLCIVVCAGPAPPRTEFCAS